LYRKGAIEISGICRESLGKDQKYPCDITDVLAGNILIWETILVWFAVLLFAVSLCAVAWNAIVKKMTQIHTRFIAIFVIGLAPTRIAFRYGRRTLLKDFPVVPALFC